mmetsp:Transcript_5652/g.7909  ORF Transcript_5652/g.7909 Transcript_5652/m.7909 type:complete len:167 (-) Transcript_5652:157-657(-)
MSYSNAKTFFLALCVLLALSSTPTSAQSNVFDQLNPFGKNVCFSSSEFGAACVQATCDNTADEEGNTECTCYVVATTSDGAQLGECARCGYCDDEELFYDCTNVEGLDSGANTCQTCSGVNINQFCSYTTQAQQFWEENRGWSIFLIIVGVFAFLGFGCVCCKLCC